MPPQEPATASGPPPGPRAGAGAPPGGAASQPVKQVSRKGTAARGMSVAPLALAVLAQVGAIGHGSGAGETAALTSTQAAKCATGITDYQACHDHYATGRSPARRYARQLNPLQDA